MKYDFYPNLYQIINQQKNVYNHKKLIIYNDDVFDYKEALNKVDQIINYLLQLKGKSTYVKIQLEHPFDIGIAAFACASAGVAFSFEKELNNLQDKSLLLLDQDLYRDVLRLQPKINQNLKIEKKINPDSPFMYTNNNMVTYKDFLNHIFGKVNRKENVSSAFYFDHDNSVSYYLFIQYLIHALFTRNSFEVVNKRLDYNLDIQSINSASENKKNILFFKPTNNYKTTYMHLWKCLESNYNIFYLNYSTNDIFNDEFYKSIQLKMKRCDIHFDAIIAYELSGIVAYNVFDDATTSQFLLMIDTPVIHHEHEEENDLLKAWTDISKNTKAANSIWEHASKYYYKLTHKESLFKNQYKSIINPLNIPNLRKKNIPMGVFCSNGSNSLEREIYTSFNWESMNELLEFKIKVDCNHSDILNLNNSIMISERLMLQLGDYSEYNKHKENLLKAFK
ncbi:hypothetical protein KMW28_22240 [Flammeovirga yaeyamensis]|uniref:AMP-dependent synthetase/ligase domain-containing protein n=1 Tax=Flammeovirga yaeyamensis TaxID=367791 RepID=A0AAX1ND46_9BACT|nr:hypothetical protein [Flammeovirga yaeyamensis]MBB3696922.1 hypothetical protein [Flammeovirga yaeyamensis]NMF33585.1 hypothetical protein [Flammeovirga yaeyamensis]QWG05147.1 hypothetical protein KMW28_22240 [Flammeovirga yaeyamensis]